MTEAEIVALDGPQLTQLARELGLRAEGESVPWEPHGNTWQAREVFFGVLPRRGLLCRAYCAPGSTSFPAGSGRFEVVGVLGNNRATATTIASVIYGASPMGKHPIVISEAHALLLCAVLAVHALQGKEDACST